MKKFGEFGFRDERGSVLMEFIIVMPIYFLLLGFAFVVGELSLHSIHLSASGDRCVAMTTKTDNAKFWRRLRRVMSPNRDAMQRRDDKTETDEEKSSYKGDLVYEGREFVSEFGETLDNMAHKEVLPGNGHWTEAVAGRAVDNYTLSPVTRGFIAHWFYETERRVYDGDLMTEKLERPEKDSIDNILDKDKGTLGRAEMKGNYYEDNEGKKIRDYGYFSLRRTKEGRGDSTVDYRKQSAADLAAGDWEKAVSEQLATVADGSDRYITESSSSGDSLKPSGGGDGGVSYDFSSLL